MEPEQQIISAALRETLYISAVQLWINPTLSVMGFYFRYSVKKMPSHWLYMYADFTPNKLGE